MSGRRKSKMESGSQAIKSREEAMELLQAKAHVWNHILRYISSMSLKCAVELGVFEVINAHGNPISLSALIASLPSINPHKIYYLPNLLRILAQSGFLSHHKAAGQEEEGYDLTTPSKLLLKDSPFTLAPFLLSVLHPQLTKPLDCISTWFMNEDSASFITANGRPIWDLFAHTPELSSSFNAAMASDSRLIAGILSNKEMCGWLFEGVGSLVDVGGGTGTTAKTIAAAYPHIGRCLVLDLPHVVADLQDSDNLINYVAGNMFESIPPADVVLLKWILHDWNDEDCLKILKKCKEATDEKGGNKVIIIDAVVGEKMENTNEYEDQLLLDMLMIALQAGKERMEKEWEKLFNDAGFSGYQITRILGVRSIIEVYP